MVDAAVVAAAGAAVEAELRRVARSVDIRIAVDLADIDSVLATVETQFMNNVLATVEDDYAEAVAEAEAVVAAEVEALA